MFEFFRYMTDELSGIDTEAAYKEKKEKEERERECEKENRIIFSKKAKKIVIGFAIFYVVITFTTLIAFKGVLGMISVLFYITKMMLAIGVLISILIGKKKGEITALSLIVVFFLFLFLSNTLVFAE